VESSPRKPRAHTERPVADRVTLANDDSASPVDSALDCEMAAAVIVSTWKRNRPNLPLAARGGDTDVRAERSDLEPHVRRQTLLRALHDNRARRLRKSLTGDDQQERSCGRRRKLKAAVGIRLDGLFLAVA
jgi:hypothetical protein